MRLTAATVRTLTLPPGKVDHVFFDAELPGFGLRVRATGAKTWMVQYAIAGKTRRMVLGSPAVLDPGKARETAKDLLAQVRLGRDPAGEKATARAKAAETFGACCRGSWSASVRGSSRVAMRRLERHLVAHAKPLHGHPIDAIDRRAVALRLAEIAPRQADRPQATGCAHRCRRSSRGPRARATSIAIRSPSPTRRSRTDRANASWPTTSWPRSGVRRGMDQYGAIVKLLMLSGARRDEIASLRWTEIDLDSRHRHAAAEPGRRTDASTSSRCRSRRSRSWRQPHRMAGEARSGLRPRRSRLPGLVRQQGRSRRAYRHSAQG